jgi:predicted TIM-barrel fold metal-dependent hydrolase
MGELFDIHVHLPDPATFPGFVKRGGKRLLMRLILRRMRVSGASVTRESIEEYNRGMLKAIKESELDRVVLLALDAPHNEDGKPETTHNAVVCTNDCVAALAGSNGKTLFGASIHPYRRDALEELERCIDKGACLVKWVPSAQNVDPRNERCAPFFDMLAAHRLPLLIHTGCEHTLAGRRNELNDPARLLPALKRGVTVIAAHCGARMLLHERSYFDVWCRLALEYETCFGDISAFVIPTRMHLLARLIRDERLVSKLLYGSDFPGLPDPASCLLRIGFRRTLALQREQNPINRSLRALQELGVPDSVFSRAGGLLRLCGSRAATA